MKNIYSLGIILCLLGCVPEPDFSKDTVLNVTSEFGAFDFATTEVIRLEFRFVDLQNQPFKGIKLELKNPTTNEVIHKAVTGSDGRYSGSLSIPTYLKEVILETGFIGLPNRLVLPKKNQSISLDYQGGVNPDQVIQYDLDPLWKNPRNEGSRILNTFELAYASSFNSSGVPSNILPDLDYISSQVLANINASLPEGQPVPTYHPTYLADGKKTTLDVVEEADVWLTFVHEGAGWRNTIGYYTYPTNQPPNTLEDIKKVTVLFPNLSKTGSGGNLTTGQKVKIGRFQAGTSVGLVLLANGWDGAKVSGWYYGLFANKKINPEPDDLLKQHNVLLWDEENKLFLLGFEDVRRDNIPIRCDQDFNDAILFVTSNPVRAISTVNVSPVDKPNTLDLDGDGINDNLDEYPNDPSKAYDSYFPSSSSYGSFAFEDSWPEIGDYDFNDLVVDYQFQQTYNASNKVTEIKSKFKFRAAGAGYRNGFGFQMQISPNQVKNVSGGVLGPKLISLNPNGTEANQAKATFIATDNVHVLFGATNFINTQGFPNYEPKEVVLIIQLNSPLNAAELGNAPYNPFVIIAQERGRELHLPGYSPTSLMNTRLLGTGDDNSLQAGYFKSRTSLPWGIHLPESFAYPKEKADIRSAHLKFNDWSKSLGTTYLDWFRDRSGYRNTEKIY